MGLYQGIMLMRAHEWDLFLTKEPTESISSNMWEKQQESGSHEPVCQSLILHFPTSRQLNVVVLNLAGAFILFGSVVLEIKPRALGMLGKHILQNHTFNFSSLSLLAAQTDLNIQQPLKASQR